MTAIPQEIREAAEVDGAGFWRRLFGIEIPLLLPITSVAVLFGVVFTFTDMTVVYVLTGGGPQNATQVLASWAFYQGINGGSLGQGAAVAVPCSRSWWTGRGDPAARVARGGELRWRPR
jgi:multiple sugar transport system permease protein